MKKKAKLPDPMVTIINSGAYAMFNTASKELLTQDGEDCVFVLVNPKTGAVSFQCFKSPPNAVVVCRITQCGYMPRVPIRKALKSKFPSGKYAATWDDVEGSLVMALKRSRGLRNDPESPGTEDPKTITGLAL